MKASPSRADDASADFGSSVQPWSMDVLPCKSCMTLVPVRRLMHVCQPDRPRILGHGNISHEWPFVISRFDRPCGQAIGRLIHRVCRRKLKSVLHAYRQPAACQAHRGLHKYATATAVVRKASEITTRVLMCRYRRKSRPSVHPPLFPPSKPSDDFWRLADSFLGDCAAFGLRGVFFCRLPSVEGVGTATTLERRGSTAGGGGLGERAHCVRRDQRRGH